MEEKKMTISDIMGRYPYITVILEKMVIGIEKDKQKYLKGYLTEDEFYDQKCNRVYSAHMAWSEMTLTKIEQRTLLRFANDYAGIVEEEQKPPQPFNDGFLYIFSSLRWQDDETPSDFREGSILHAEYFMNEEWTPIAMEIEQVTEDFAEKKAVNVMSRFLNYSGEGKLVIVDDAPKILYQKCYLNKE